MKRLLWILSLAAVAGTSVCSAQSIYGRGRMSGGQGAVERITILIKADGSSVATNESVTARATMEQGLRMWEMWKKRADAGDDEGVDRAAPQKPETKPYTDAELAERIRETETLSSEQYGTDPQKIEAIDIKTNTVRMVRRQGFTSLSDFLAKARATMGGSLSMENVRFETTNGQLRVTLSPAPGMQRYAKTARQQWKQSSAVSEVRFIFPGKVLSSGLPNTQDNTTWISVDGEKPETVDALMKLHDAPIIILCELGGLKLDAPLDSKTLQRQARQPAADAGESVPITDAGPGYVTEGISVTTSSVLLFPEGEKFLKDALQYSMSQTGTTVRAKLFAPKGRTLKTASGVRVLKAVDDKGREIGSLAGEAEDVNGRTFSAGNSRNKSAPPLILTLRLPLPAADASSITELSGEVIALTVGRWKDFTVTNLQANATNEIDLGSILPGATLALTKVSTRNQQLQLQARLKGPKEIRQLELQCQKPGDPEFNTHANDMNFSTKTNGSIRTVNIQGYSYGEERGGGGPIVLLVRNPDDLRRERVRFSLKDLDLF
jgi:hypothetical protein